MPSDSFTKEKIWQFNVNQLHAATDSVYHDCQLMLWQIVTAMTGFASSAWVARISSDSVAEGAGNRWVSSANVVWNTAGNAHSWIVLTNAAGWEILFDCNATVANCSKLTIIFNPTAAWDNVGSNTAAPTPTAGKFYTFKTGGTWNTYALTGIAGGRVHVMMTTDGQCTRVAAYSAGILTTSMLFETLTDVVAGVIPWAVPVVCLCNDAAANHFTIAGLGTTLGFFTRYNDVSYAGTATTESTLVGPVPVTQLVAGVPNDISGGYGGSQVGFASTAAGFRGRHGRFQDMWIGSASVTDGDTYPKTGTLYQFAQFHHMITPWNSLTPVDKV